MLISWIVSNILADCNGSHTHNIYVNIILLNSIVEMCSVQPIKEHNFLIVYIKLPVVCFMYSMIYTA